MVFLIAEIEVNCFYIIFSILFVWHRSDLFKDSLWIDGCVSLHNQTPPYITLSMLVFTSHCICFYYIMICPVSSACTIGVVSFAWPNALPVDFEQIIISVILFNVLLAKQIMIFSRSAAHFPLVLSCLRNPIALAAYFEQVIVLVICFMVICFLPCLLTRYWFVSC